MFKKLNDEAFIIAEVGQNHQGDLEKAKQYISKFAELGADAVKFQTRDNKYLFSENAYNNLYNSETSFADTYGAHREFLELDPESLHELRDLCHQKNVKFMSTPFDEPSLTRLLEVNVDILKIASFDLGNLPFINKLAKSGKPIVISTGGGSEMQIAESIKILLDSNCEVAILHCVSEYPCTYDRLGLENIKKLIQLFPMCSIGLSDHFNGILSGPIAYTEGARVFEKHVTFNRSWKGTDHNFALEPHGFESFVRDINRVPKMMKSKPKGDLGKEQVFAKLGKSITAAEDIKAGEKFTLNNLSGRIFEKQYLPVRESHKLIGKQTSKNINKGEPVLIDYVV